MVSAEKGRISISLSVSLPPLRPLLPALYHRWHE